VPAKTMLTVELPPSGILEAVYALVNARQPGCIWGQPGVGKSEMIRTVADVIYAPLYGMTFDGQTLRDSEGMPTNERPYLVDLRVSLLDPVDLMGLPTIGPDGRQTFAMPDWFPTDERGGILLLDELTRGTTQIMNALLQLSLDRRLGKHRLPDAWAIMAASNRLTDGGGVTKMPDALAERFTHLDATHDHDEWLTWAINNDLHPLVIAFTKWKPDLFCQRADNERVGTNPRTWKFASDILKANPAPAVELALMAGTTGVGVASELMGFVRNFRSCPSIDSIIADPHNATVPGPLEPSSLFAIASALTARLIEDEDTAESIGIYLDRMPTEYAAMTWKEAGTKNIGLTHTRPYIRFTTEHPEIN
jgi:hypothetical protein